MFLFYLKAFSKSTSSLKFTSSNPGVKGPKFVNLMGSSLAPAAVILLPQKHPFAKTTVALSLSTPLFV